MQASKEQAEWHKNNGNRCKLKHKLQKKAKRKSMDESYNRTNRRT
jgi:hypothetical protein